MEGAEGKFDLKIYFIKGRNLYPYIRLGPQFVCERFNLTVCVTRGWVGQGSAILPELTLSHENSLKSQRLPPVGCTLCWAGPLMFYFTFVCESASAMWSP
jgi:hypothetical protein